MPNHKIFNASKIDEGKRLDNFLFEKGVFHTRSQIKKMIDKKLVLLNGKAVKAGVKIKKNSIIKVTIPEVIKTELIPCEIELDFIYEDSSIAVINKPPGLVVHPAPGHESDTLVNAILNRVKDLKPILGELRPGIVHRLDKDTSGVIVVAKDQKSLFNLSGQFKERKVKKIYHVLTVGEIPVKSFCIDKQVIRSERDRKKMAASSVKGRKAQTFFNVIEKFKGVTYLEAMPKTGRTHQIRVHLSNEGYPIVGDQLYLKNKRISEIKDKEVRARLSSFPRQALHAHVLEIAHPESNKQMKFTAPIPEDMNALIKFLRS